MWLYPVLDAACIIFQLCIWDLSFSGGSDSKGSAFMQIRSLGGHPLEKGMATHSSIFAWRIPWIEEPGGVQFMGSQRVGHDRATNTRTHAHTHTRTHTRRIWFHQGSNPSPLHWEHGILTSGPPGKFCLSVDSFFRLNIHILEESFMSPY